MLPLSTKITVLWNTYVRHLICLFFCVDACAFNQLRVTTKLAIHDTF